MSGSEIKNDYMVRAVAADGSIRAFAVTSRDLVEEGRKRHNSSPVVTAALGRLMSGGVMMGAMMKGEDDLLTIQVRSTGPMGGMTVTADSAGHVKGYPYVPDVVIPANGKGKLDVAGAVGGRDHERDQGHGTERTLCGTDRASDRGDRGRPDLLFCRFRTDTFFRRSGRADEPGQYSKMRRRIYYPADAFYSGRGH